MGEPQRFEDVLTRLQALVAQLEGGQLSLDASLAAFEEGVGLSRQGAAMLDEAERKIELLLRDEREEPSGAPRPQPTVVPFAAEGAAPTGAGATPST